MAALLVQFYSLVEAPQLAHHQSLFTFARINDYILHVFWHVSSLIIRRPVLCVGTSSL